MAIWKFRPPAEKPPFTRRAFAVTIGKLLGLFALVVAMLFTILAVISGPFRPHISIVMAYFYLAFVLSWAATYTKFFRFPERQPILLLGVIVGAALLALSQFLGPEATDMAPLSDILTALGGGVIGSAFQLYGAALLLRFVPFIQPRI